MYLRRPFVARRWRQGFDGRRRMSGLGERRRFDGRRYGVGGYIGRRHAGRYRARRHGMGRFRGMIFSNRRGAGPATSVAPLPTTVTPVAPQAPAVPEWLLNGPVPPPAFWCSDHGWVICPLHGYGSAVDVDAVGQSPASVFEFGSTSAAAADANTVAPRLPSPTPAFVEMEGDTSAYVSAPTGASTFVFGSGVRSFSSAATVDAVAPATPATPPRLPSATPATPLRLPSPTPATPPPRRRLMPFGFAALSPPSSSRATRAGTWSPAALGLANGVSNGIAPGTLLPGGSSDEDVDERGGSAARRRWTPLHQQPRRTSRVVVAVEDLGMEGFLPYLLVQYRELLKYLGSPDPARHIHMHMLIN